MNSKRSGFTLIELLVVVLILGVLASVGTPAYLKTLETSRATDSVGMVAMIANAQRMCLLDNNQDATQCPASQLSTSNVLVQKKYMTDSGWQSSYYTYSSCNGANCCGGSGYACSQRSGSGTYSGWAYYVDASGICHALGGAPACPNL